MVNMAPITLTPDQVDDLIYSARVGDLEALQSDLSTLSVQYSVPQSVVIASAIDTEPEEEGGTGSCLLHFPAANGNVEILTHLLSLLVQAPSSSALSKEDMAAVINLRNHSGNTALHWAALNTHLECVKALVEAGADVSIKNQAGLDAVFLAERADWSAQEEGQEQQEEGVEEVEVEIGAQGEGEGAAAAGPVTKGRQVVEWLLAADKSDEAEGLSAANAGGGEEAK
ncbi:ankyrin repeat-containing domain protein [Aspergillus pseudoustus]|uniref:Ankyrin repeat-containing domain protein n=1 Tax=Aspergillus pseudoustus TaxID=1810923 RepID=A0ABR4J0I5_9EURO